MIKRLIAFSLLVLALSPAWGQKGPITSNLKKVLFYFYNFSGTDHQNTPFYAGYMKTLGTTYGFTVDTTRSQSVFTAANLANYQVIFLFSAYNFGTNMTAGQKAAVQAWYSENRGIGCFHQCVKNLWGGTYPNWYDSLMGTQYQTWAGFGSGPVYVNAAAEGTDLAMGITSAGAETQYKTDYTLSWDDEWYTYNATPSQSLGGKTTLIWTTKRSAHSFGASFSTPGETQAMAWAREVKGGRFVLNSFFHRDAPRTSTNADLRKFIDGAWIGSLRYLAGYTGCTDSSYVEYNPKATHMGTGACVTKLGVGVRISPMESKQAIRMQDLKVHVTDAASHRVELVGVDGKRLVGYRNKGPREYDFSQFRNSGVYFVRVTVGSKTVTKRFLFH
jgi:hypothetical protein